jgi:uncharacterized protein YbjT (DUF2867 family)
MRVFVAGSTGAVGTILVPTLLASGHEVVTLIHTPERAKGLAALGARVSIADALDKDELIASVKRAEPEVILHQVTAIKGVSNFKKFDEEFALNLWTRGN